MLSPHLRCSTCAEPLRTSMVPQVLSALEVAKGGAGAQQAGVEIHEEDGMAIRVVEGAHSKSTQSSEFTLARRTGLPHSTPRAGLSMTHSRAAQPHSNTPRPGLSTAHSRADTGVEDPNARPL